MHWFKWNIQIMWYPEPYLDSIITKCDFIQEGLFSTFWISKIWLQFVMKQGVPDNRFNVCEELTFSRTFRKNSTERNKQDLNSQLNDIFTTHQCYSFHIKDQGIIQMKLMQLLQHRQHRSKRVRTKRGPEGSMDPHFGPGPWTTFMDWVHGPPVMDRVQGYFFLSNENWTKTEIVQKKRFDKMLFISLHTLLTRWQSQDCSAYALQYKDSHYEQAEV